MPSSLIDESLTPVLAAEEIGYAVTTEIVILKESGHQRQNWSRDTTWCTFRHLRRCLCRPKLVSVTTRTSTTIHQVLLGLNDATAAFKARRSTVEFGYGHLNNIFLALFSGHLHISFTSFFSNSKEIKKRRNSMFSLSFPFSYTHPQKDG